MIQSFVQNDIATLTIECTTNIREDIIVLSGQETIVIGLSGGTSLDAFYANLKGMFLELPLEIAKKIRFVFLDERIVPLSDTQSNYRSIGKAFLDSLIEAWIYEPWQIMTVNMEVDDAATEYGERVPHIDIALFGVGEDGHIASLFPHHPLLSSTDTGYVEIVDSPKSPSNRITVSPHMIRTIIYAYIFFIGERKKTAYINFLSPDIAVADCPAKLIFDSKQYMSFSDIIV